MPHVRILLVRIIARARQMQNVKTVLIPILASVKKDLLEMGLNVQVTTKLIINNN